MRDGIAQQRHQVGGDHQDPVLGLVDHRREVRGGQPGVQRVADQPDPHRRIIDLQMRLRIPGQRPHPVAEGKAQRGQRPRQPVAAIAQRRITDPPACPARICLHDLAIGKPLRRVIQELVDGQAVGLHRALSIGHEKAGAAPDGRGDRHEGRQKLFRILMPYWRGGPAKSRLLCSAAT